MAFDQDERPPLTVIELTVGETVAGFHLADVRGKTATLVRDDTYMYQKLEIAEFCKELRQERKQKSENRKRRHKNS